MVRRISKTSVRLRGTSAFAVMTVLWFCVAVASGQSSSAAREKWVFEVISIRLDNSETLLKISPTLDGYEAKGISAKTLIMSAFDLKLPDLLVGLPGWADSLHFAVRAKIGEDTLSRLKQMPEKQQWEARSQMLRAMLQERFHLKAHYRMKVEPIYALIVAKSGIKAKLALPGETPQMMGYPSGRIRARATSLDDLADSLSGDTGRLVINRTGLDGLYNFDLKAASASNLSEEGSEPSLFTALEDQLGLKLQPTSSEVQALQIDSIDKPTSN